MVLNYIFQGSECTVQEILDSREQRVQTYTKMAGENKCTNVVTLCVNMPGKVKNNPAASLFFNEGAKLLKTLIPNPAVIEEKQGKTGCELYIGTHCDSIELKKTILLLEDKYKWMRMLDIDVVDSLRGHISRTELNQAEQKCFVCGKTAKECCGHGLHTEIEIKKVISEYYADLTAFIVGNAADESLIQEALCTPKPGLVDQNNNGSHKDMNLQLLKRSAATLQPFFEQMCRLGFTNAGLKELRSLGVKAEQAMFKATDNVNTHKGAVFSLGLIAFCYGKCLLNNEVASSTNICNRVRDLVVGIENEVPEEVIVKRGYGARGQAAEGYSIITKHALPFYRQALKTEDNGKALYLTLLLIISMNNDSNILSRSDVKTLAWAQMKSLELFEKRADKTEVKELDREFIKKNISPGGSADLLATTYFLNKICQEASNT